MPASSSAGFGRIDVAPVVDFDLPYSRMRDLMAQRQALNSVIGEIRHVEVEVGRFDAEAQRYASYAALWAATLMVCNILRIGLSAFDRRANLLFVAQDRALERARKVMKVLGLHVASKQDLMDNLDANLRGVANLAGGVRWARDELKKHGVKAPKEADLLISLGVSMTEDTLLVMQAGQLVQQSRARAFSARAGIEASLGRLLRKLVQIDVEMAYLIELAQKRASTA